jgi:phosphatidylglycerophosphatase A
MAQSTLSSFNRLFRKTGASVFFIGYLPASGTVASAVTVAALWLAKEKFGFLGAASATSQPWYWLALLALAGVSMFFASHSRELFGKEDSGKIVIDEVVGQLFTFLFLPLTTATLLTGFFLFRFFDIVKPFPIHHMEALEEGVGVTMDDVVAGVLANASLILIHVGYHAVKAHL